MINQVHPPQGLSWNHNQTHTGEMKSILYISMALGALLLPASEGLRNAAVVVIKSVATGIERLIVRGNYAEIRVVEGDQFDEVINAPGRLVLVAVQSELSSVARGEADGLNQAMMYIVKTTIAQNNDLVSSFTIID